MARGMTASCMKYTLLVLNLFVFFLGAAIVGVGAYSLTTGDIQQIASIPLSVTASMIAVGCLLSVVGFFGCCGAGRESRGLLGFYMFFIVVLVLAQVAIGVGAFIFQSQVETVVEQGWTNANETTRQWTEKTFTCCGFKQPGDTPGNNCPVVSSEGCFPKLVDFFKTRLRIVEIIVLVVASVQVMSLLFSIFLFRSVRTEADERRALLADARRVHQFYRNP